MPKDEFISQTIAAYHLPRYQDIPGVGLYLKQVMNYINGYLQPLNGMLITESMISNYVKMHLVENPEKKMYSRDQIARLMFIAVAKSVMSLDSIQLLFDVQNRSYPLSSAYDFFCREFEKSLCAVFGLENPPALVPEEEEWKSLLQNVIFTSVRIIYLEYCFRSAKTRQE